MSDDTSFIDGNQMYAKLIEVGNAWADKKAAYSALEAVTKVILAEISKKNVVDEGRTRVTAEMMALANPTYKEHLDSVAAAHKSYLRAQVRYESLKTLVELRRSEEATRRAETRVL